MKNLKFEKPSSTFEISEDGKKAVFQIKALERGYGLTLGNALRRVLLASMPGAAIINVKIEGVEHEFSTIPGVYEDVMSIVLKLKQVVVKVDSLDPDFEQKLSLYKEGPGKVVAGDFEKVTGVEIINPELEIANLMEKTQLNMEVTIRRGIGYVSADDNKVFSKNEIGLIAIDSLFSPIKRVAYHIEKTRGDDDELNLEIETDGSIDAKDALGIASKMLIDYLDEIKNISEHPLVQDEYLEEIKVEKRNDFLDATIDKLEDLKVQVLNALKKKAIMKVGELVELSEKTLRTFDQIGPEAIKNIQDSLKKHNLSLKDSKTASEE